MSSSIVNLHDTHPHGEGGGQGAGHAHDPHHQHHFTTMEQQADTTKIGMWLFLVSDSITFGALLVSCMYARVASPNWPTPFPAWPSIAFASVMTLCLLTSSLTMVWAVDASKKGDRVRAVKNIIGTMVGGGAFMVLHANEWLRLIAEGVTPWHNPWGAPLFGAAFFATFFAGVDSLQTGQKIRALGRRRLHHRYQLCNDSFAFRDLNHLALF